MRGDSLRDLKAKALAVVGLGLLAGAGAVVDYWPLGAPLPSVKDAGVPRPAVPALVQDLNVVIPAPSFTQPVVSRPAIFAHNVGRAVFLEPSLPAIEPVVVPAPPPPAPEPDALPIETAVPAFLAASGGGVTMFDAPPSPLPTSGFLGGAFKKTRDSILRTGARTGASIADAFRGVFGAFKKVSPF